MKTTYRNILVTAATCLLAIASSITTAAVIVPIEFPHDAKVYHSSECQPEFNLYANALYYREQGLENLGNVLTNELPIIQVVCPIVRDNTRNTNGTLGVEIYVTNVAGKHLSCSLYSYDTHSTKIQESIASTLLGGKRTLKADVNLSKDSGHYSLRCMLPAHAKIHAYKVKEWLDGNINRTDWFN